ncbi:SAVMC3_10250 family protein (plasmid) [Embleya sp. NBC_00888]|uniref:SAVMC3_10250 family protein n=1 Tax=Embleya sp. NBC_00888 TaxID=2975960 RepID=UPI002F91203D|nr:SAVMC3_10250 family protein [Embleya sp. NBC_00888]
MTPASARGVFPDTGVLPGDHFSIIRPDSADHLSYLVLKANIEAVTETSTTPTVVGSGVRDYVYVSARKVARIARTLPPDSRARVDGAAGTVGHPSSADIADGMASRAEDVIAFVSEVEGALEREHGVKDVHDEELRTGHWFRLRGVPMLYGLPEAGVDGVIFVGETDGVRFALGGSAEYLLDRPTQHLVRLFGGEASSSLPGTRAMLERVVRLERRRDVEPEDVEFLTHDDFAGDILGREYESLTRGLKSGRQPMTAFARCLHVDRTPDGTGTVLGTPLYVAFSVPEGAEIRAATGAEVDPAAGEHDDLVALVRRTHRAGPDELRVTGPVVCRYCTSDEFEAVAGNCFCAGCCLPLEVDDGGVHTVADCETAIPETSLPGGAFLHPRCPSGHDLFLVAVAHTRAADGRVLRLSVGLKCPYDGALCLYIDNAPITPREP